MSNNRERRGGIIQTTFPLGRIFGVRVGVNWSVLVIFALIAYGLAAQRFPTVYPGLGSVAYIAAGIITAVVFFVSLLAHELAHSVVARRNGISVEGITLWLFGGVSRLQGEASNPAAELRIAGVGPLTSLALAAVFFAAAFGLSGTGTHGIVVGGLGWLGAINLALAVFNAIPAAPLDGGRLLRAFLWWRTRDRLKATVWSSRAGQVFGWILIALGLLTFFTTGQFGGLWIAVIGWFLMGAASAEGQQAIMRERLSGVPVWQVMTPDPVTAPGSMSVTEFFEGYLMRHRHSTFPVTKDGGEPVGLVTFNRIKHVSAQERDVTLLRDIACPLAEVAAATPNEPVVDLLPRFTSCAEGRALVFDDGRLVGIVSPSDVARTLDRLSVARGHVPLGR